jgi:hypothetical protein
LTSPPQRGRETPAGGDQRRARRRRRRRSDRAGAELS